MRLLENQRYVYNNKEYIINLDKVFYTEDKGRDFYIYQLDVYEVIEKIVPLLNIKYTSKIFIKTCKTFWLDYFSYEGNIEVVIQDIIKKIEIDLAEQVQIKNIENNYSKEENYD